MTSRDTTSRPSAVVWINEHHAIVARTRGTGHISMAEIERGPEAETQYLAHVVHEIGDPERVMIVGQDPVRLALELEYVSISHRPERLVALPPALRGDGGEIVDRLFRLAA